MLLSRSPTIYAPISQQFLPILQQLILMIYMVKLKSNPYDFYDISAMRADFCMNV